MSDAYAYVIILGLAVITVVCRCFFLWPDREVPIPDWLRAGLRYAPLAALTAVIVPEIVLTQGQLIDSLKDARVFGAGWHRVVPVAGQHPRDDLLRDGHDAGFAHRDGLVVDKAYIVYFWCNFTPYTMNAPVDTSYRNPLRAKLKAGQHAYGLWVTISNPTISEIAAELGVDWVCLDLEHSALTYADVANHARAAKGSGMAVVARVPAITQDTIKRCLDMGVDGVLLPLVNSLDDLDEGLRYAKYPPQGIRGIGGERALRWGMRMTEYLASANEETMVIPLIETAAAVRAADTILSSPHLDAIFFGPADLSATHGHLGAWEAPGVAEDILAVRRKAADRGIASGIMAMDDADTVMRKEQGFRMIGLGSDFGMLIRSMKPVLKTLKGTSFDRRWF